MVQPSDFAPVNLGAIYAQGQQIQGQQEDRKFRLGELMQRQQQQEREREVERITRTAPYAARARQLPREQRRAFMDAARPNLRALGWTDEQLNSVNLDDDSALEALAAGGQSVEQINQRGRIRWVTVDGVGTFAVDDATGQPVTPGQVGNPLEAGQAPAQPTPQAQATPGSTPTGGYATGVASALSSAGLPAPVVAGILANGHYESGGWNIQNSGDGGTAHGAFQWRNERADNFRRIVGVDPRSATPEQTARFVLHELQNPQEAGMTPQQAQAILNARTPQEAAMLFSRYYERPNARMANNSRRVALAGQYAQGAAPAAPQASPAQSLQEQARSGVIVAGQRPPPGYTPGPGGTLQAIPGGPGDRTYDRARDERTDARAERGEIGTVLREFRSDPDVRKWRAARAAVQQLGSLSRSGTAADDIAIVYTFMKALDSISAVREGEFDVAQNSAGLRQRGEAYLAQLQQGTRLTPQQRREMVATAGRMYTDLSRVYNEITESYREQALTMGVPPQRVGRMFQRARAPDAADRRTQQPPQRAGGRTSSGVRWRRVGD